MKLSTEAIKTLVFSLVVAFAGHVIAAPTWFSGTALNNVLSADNADWTTNVVGDVTVTGNVLEIDLPTNTVVKLEPSSQQENKKTCVTVSDAVFTPTAYDDIDSSVVEGSQTALTVAYDNSSTNYYAYITNSWVKLEGATPSTGPVNVTVVLDYSVSTQTNVSFEIGAVPLHGEGTVYKFPITASERVLKRIDLAGYGKLHSITTTVETVEIKPQSVTYGADFTNVTVTAAVSSTADGTSYYLTWNGVEYSVPGVISSTENGDVVTFENVQIKAPTSPYQKANYVITAKVDNSPIYVTDSVPTPIADVKDWIDERADTTTTAEAGGSWNPAVSYDDISKIATITGEKTFTASNCSTGDLVRITFSNIVYAEVSDLGVETPYGTQGAFALSDNGGSTTNFYVLTKPADTYEWVAATCAGVEANTNISYTVEMSFNYTNNTYSVAVSDAADHSGVLRVDGLSEFAICADKTNVTDFVFKGNGTLKSITGEDCTGYMAKDAAGGYWVTIQQAIDYGTGPFTILRATDTNAKYNGWKFDNSDGVWKLVKAAVGMFFFAF